MLSSIITRINDILDDFELLHVHKVWEDVANQTTCVLTSSSSKRASNKVPEIDLNTLVPCQHAQSYLLQEYTNIDYDKEDSCRLRDVITQQLLIKYVKQVYDEDFELSSHPIILRNVWSSESLNSSERRLTPNGILNDEELASVQLPNYFSDATKSGYNALVPDVVNQTSLSQFVQGILSGETPNAKIGTQVIIEQIPELKDEIIPSSLAKSLFNWNTYLEDIKERIKKWTGEWIEKILPPMSYFPVFIASNHQSDDDEVGTHPRTDLHMEPIGNIASQLHGTRQWILVPTKWSALLWPTVSKHRGYFYANIDPSQLTERLSHVPVVYNCTTGRGDILWIPPWMWHRVDYNSNDDEAETAEDKLSIGASVFHFFPTLFVKTNPLFSWLILPLLIQEILGFNVE